MDFANLPLFKLMSQRMDWLSQRHSVLAQNIANADTPGYLPRDIAPASFRALVRGQPVRLEPRQTDSAHISASGGDGRLSPATQITTYETSLSGNAVVLEEQLLKVGETNMDYQLTTNLYRKYLNLFRIALGRGGAI